VSAAAWRMQRPICFLSPVGCEPHRCSQCDCLLGSPSCRGLLQAVQGRHSLCKQQLGAAVALGSQSLHVTTLCCEHQELLLEGGAVRAAWCLALQQSGVECCLRESVVLGCRTGSLLRAAASAETLDEHQCGCDLYGGIVRHTSTLMLHLTGQAMSLH